MQMQYHQYILLMQVKTVKVAAWTNSGWTLTIKTLLNSQTSTARRWMDSTWLVYLTSSHGAILLLELERITCVISSIELQAVLASCNEQFEKGIVYPSPYVDSMHVPSVVTIIFSPSPLFLSNRNQSNCVTSSCQCSPINKHKTWNPVKSQATPCLTTQQYACSHHYHHHHRN